MNPVYIRRDYNFERTDKHKIRLCDGLSVVRVMCEEGIEADLILIGTDITFVICNVGEELGMWEDFIGDKNYNSIALDEFELIKLEHRQSTRKPFKLRIISAEGASLAVALTEEQTRALCTHLCR